MTRFGLFDEASPDDVRRTGTIRIRAAVFGATRNSPRIYSSYPCCRRATFFIGARYEALANGKDAPRDCPDCHIWFRVAVEDTLPDDDPVTVRWTTQSVDDDY